MLKTFLLYLRRLLNSSMISQTLPHAIGFMPGSQLPNLLAYHMNPVEYVELKRQVDELLSKGFIRESSSPCVVPRPSNFKER